MRIPCENRGWEPSCPRCPATSGWCNRVRPILAPCLGSTPIYGCDLTKWWWSWIVDLWWIFGFEARGIESRVVRSATRECMREIRLWKAPFQVEAINRAPIKKTGGCFATKKEKEKCKLPMSLRLCLFWVKIIFGNAFLEMRLFGWSEKFYFLEIEIRWQKKKAFDHGNQLPLLFSLQRISGKREREREHARERRRPVRAPVRVDFASSSPTTAIDALRDRAVDRDLAKRRSRSRLREIAPDRDRNQRCDLTKRRS